MAVHRREVSLSDSTPIVSFTFDDFPRSAVQVGGAILKSYGVRGTYYAAMGLMDHVNALGQHFSAADIETVLRDGHELGSHTFSHVSCRALTLGQFEQEADRGKGTVERVSGPGLAHHFSYPYGHVTHRAKPRIGSMMSSCRGIIPGVNASPLDLNLLRANSLYSKGFDPGTIDRLIRLNVEKAGWLIFYTHDISNSPSAYGCTAAEFESVVRLATKGGGLVLPVREAVCRANAFQAHSKRACAREILAEGPGQLHDLVGHRR